MDFFNSSRCGSISRFQFHFNNEGSQPSIEVLSAPAMGRGHDSEGYYPYVTAKVKNISNCNVQVRLTCTIYYANGDVNENISSINVTLAPGDTITLTAYGRANGFYAAMPLFEQYCASFGNVYYNEKKL